MGEVKVTFHGICTIMNETPLGALVASPQRIVLVNASMPSLFSRIPEHARIQPHYARLHIRASDLVSIGPLPVQQTEPVDDEWMRFDLDGVSVKIANSVPGAINGAGARCLPHLRIGTMEPLSEPSPDTETGGYNIACIFELTSGRLEGQQADQGAGIAVLRTATIDTNTLLSIAKFDGKGLIEIGLRPNSEIVVTNLPDQEGADEEVDFLLHYLTAKNFPEDATPPLSCFCKPAKKVNTAGLTIMVGPGCSNSNYP
ncbi:MAG TPA: hypothetical protein VGQ76_18625 [Thermoanaerobaculia bacterium]|jgi:hypothetical protein|nr:hypothetical protein [Thermoanaerobaculia bacterium]